MKTNRNVKRETRISIGLSACLGLVLAGLSGCGDKSNAASDGAAAAGTTFDASLADNPCKIAPPDLVARTFGVAADNLDQSDFGSDCSYELDEDEDGVAFSAEVSAESFDTAQAAAESFRNETRNMSAGQVSDAMSKIKTQAGKDGGLDTEAKQDAANKVGDNVASGGIHFEDVGGVGDKARFGTSTGDLKLLISNMILRVNAYHGPDMPLPDVLTGESMMKAGQDWQKKTMPERKQQAVKLAKAVVAAL